MMIGSLWVRRMQAVGMAAVLVIALTLIWLPQKASAADEYDQLRTKWYSMLTGGAYSTSDPDVAAQIDKITSTAQAYRDTMDVSSGRTYLWSDLNINSTTISATDRSSYMTLNFQRLEAMALAYRMTTDPLKAADLLSVTTNGLDWICSQMYHVSRDSSNNPIQPPAEPGNWFDWEIGTPLTLNNSTILLYDKLTPAQIQSYMDAVDYFQPSVQLTGSNRAWESTIIGVRGIIVKDSAKIAAGRDGLTNLFDYVTSGDGYYTDGSFIQHQYYAYTGQYGESLLTNLVNIIYVLNGSTWAVTTPKLQNAYQWIYHSYEPLMYQGEMMDMSRGRAISRRIEQDHVIGMRIVKALIQMSQFAPAADAANFKSMVKHWIQTDTFYPFNQNVNSLYHLVLGKAIVNDSSIPSRGEPVGYIAFPAMDRAVQRRPDFGFALSLTSSRIANYESINGENLKGWYTGNGMTSLYNQDLGQFSDEYWGLVDMHRLPGTTVDSMYQPASGYRSTKNWVGGADVAGTYGAVGMDLQYPSNPLVGKKSWFLFKDKIVALGAGIQGSTTGHIESIVENRKIKDDGSNTLTVNGVAMSSALGWSESMSGVNRIHLQGNVPGSDIGYYFPGGATIQGLRQARTGSWSSVNTYAKTKDTTVLTKNFLTLWFDHGANPSGGTYSYVILPNKTSAQLDSYASNPDVQILENSSDAQAVRDTTEHVTGINFWNNISKTVNDNGIPFVTSSGQASVMTLDSASELDVGISDPTQANTGTIQLEINKAAGALISADPGVTVTQLQPTIKISVNVAGAKGMTFHAKFDYRGTVHLNEDFNATTTGAAPAGWSLDTSGGAATVAEDPSAANKSLQLVDTSAVSAVFAKKTFTPSTTPVTAEFKLKMGAENYYAAELRSGASTAAVRLRTFGGKLQVNNGGVYTDLQSYTANTWYSFKIVADPSTDKADIYIDGVLKQAAGSFDMAASAIDSIQFGTHSTTANMTMLVDDVSVYNGGVSVNELFNDTTTGAAPAGWSLDTSGGTATVAEDPSAVNKSLQLVDTSAVSAVFAKKTFTPSTTAVTAEFKMKMGAEDYYAVELRSGSSTAAVRVRTLGGKLQVNNAGVYTDLQPYTAGTWYSFKIIADPVTDKADLYIDGILKQAAGSFDMTASSIDSIQFATHSTTTNMSLKVDDVTVLN